MFYCGIDLSNQSTALCVIDEQGAVVKQGEVRTEELGVHAFLKEFKDLKCVVEATALAEWMCEVIEDLGHKIEIVDPRKAKAVTQTKKKTDKVDAEKLAQLSRVGWYTAVHRKSGRARGLRSYLTARNDLVKAGVALKSSIRGLFRAHGVKLPPGGDGKVFEESVREALKKAQPLLRQAIQPLLSTWREILKREAAMYRKVEKDFGKKSVECRLLMSAPGIGPVTAAAYVATIDDPKRFESGEKVASYLGLVPSIYQSGETEIRGRITKEGDKFLRWLLIEAAHNLLSRSYNNCALREWGLRLQKEKGVGKARVAVARKLAMILHRIWLTGEPFNRELSCRAVA